MKTVTSYEQEHELLNRLSKDHLSGLPVVSDRIPIWFLDVLSVPKSDHQVSFPRRLLDRILHKPLHDHFPGFDLLLPEKAAHLREDCRRLLADVKICAQSSDDVGKVEELVKNFCSQFRDLEQSMLRAVTERNNRTMAYLHGLTTACRELHSSRKAEVMCPYPGCIQQRIDSGVYLDHLCQCLSQLSARLGPSVPWIVDKDLVMMTDSFLQAAECRDEYICKSLSDFPSTWFPLKLERLFGPVELMEEPDKAELLQVCRKFMKCFDALVSVIESVPPDLTTYVSISESIRTHLSAVNSRGRTIRNRYMPVV